MENAVTGLFCKWLRKTICLTVAFVFVINSFCPVSFAKSYPLPFPGAMVHLSPPMDPPVLRGIKIYADNPFRFGFIIDSGGLGRDSSQLIKDPATKELRQESAKLVRYFLAGLTVPEQDQWVNLSPYEKDRVVPEGFGQTEMGRDLLAEDYVLKQVTASLIYPQEALGKKFWGRVYEEAYRQFGTTDVPVNTFNKVWVAPEKARVSEHQKSQMVFIVESRLKVMLEEDYLAQQHQRSENHTSSQFFPSLGSRVIREIVIPQLIKEVNENGNFARLRQAYNSLILAAWYKKRIKDSILSRIYADKGKVVGVNIDDPKEKKRIYERYLLAFKKGVYSYVKEEQDVISGQVVPRKYFSGGMSIDPSMMMQTGAPGEVPRFTGKSFVADVVMLVINGHRKGMDQQTAKQVTSRSLRNRLLRNALQWAAAAVIALALSAVPAGAERHSVAPAYTESKITIINQWGDFSIPGPVFSGKKLPPLMQRWNKVFKKGEYNSDEVNELRYDILQTTDPVYRPYLLAIYSYYKRGNVRNLFFASHQDVADVLVKLGESSVLPDVLSHYSYRQQSSYSLSYDLYTDDHYLNLNLIPYMAKIDDPAVINKLIEDARSDPNVLLSLGLLHRPDVAKALLEWETSLDDPEEKFCLFRSLFLQNIPHDRAFKEKVFRLGWKILEDSHGDNYREFVLYQMKKAYPEDLPLVGAFPIEDVSKPGSNKYSFQRGNLDGFYEQLQKTQDRRYLPWLSGLRHYLTSSDEILDSLVRLGDETNVVSWLHKRAGHQPWETNLYDVIKTASMSGHSSADAYFKQFSILKENPSARVLDDLEYKSPILLAVWDAPKARQTLLEWKPDDNKEERYRTIEHERVDLMHALFYQLRFNSGQSREIERCLLRHAEIILSARSFSDTEKRDALRVLGKMNSSQEAVRIIRSTIIKEYGFYSTVLSLSSHKSELLREAKAILESWGQTSWRDTFDYWNWTLLIAGFFGLGSLIILYRMLAEFYRFVTQSIVMFKVGRALGLRDGKALAEFFKSNTVDSWGNRPRFWTERYQHFMRDARIAAVPILMSPENLTPEILLMLIRGGTDPEIKRQYGLDFYMNPYKRYVCLHLAAVDFRRLHFSSDQIRELYDLIAAWNSFSENINENYLIDIRHQKWEIELSNETKTRLVDEFQKVLAEINGENYTAELYLTALFIKFRKDYPSFGDCDYGLFTKLLRKEPLPPNAPCEFKDDDFKVKGQLNDLLSEIQKKARLLGVRFVFLPFYHDDSLKCINAFIHNPDSWRYLGAKAPMSPEETREKIEALFPDLTPKRFKTLSGDERGVIESFVMRVIDKSNPLSREEKEMIVRMVRAFNQRVLQELGEDSSLTMRDLRRFNKDLTSLYKMHRDLEHLFLFFVITAHNVYGRVLHSEEDNGKFIQIIQTTFNGSHSADEIEQLMYFADYHNVVGSFNPEDFLKTDVLINRAAFVNRPLLLNIDDSNVLLIHRRLQALAEKEDHEVIFIPVSRFSGRKDILGRPMPIHGTNQMPWEDGPLLQIIKRARLNPDKKFVIVMDNISTMEGQERLSFNPIFMERKVEIPEKGETVDVPVNVDFILTKHKDTTIDDNTFENRLLVHDVRSMSDDDFRLFLIQSVLSLPPDALDRLMAIREKLRKIEESFAPYTEITNYDFLAIARNAAGILKDNGGEAVGVLDQEAYHYLFLKLRTKMDRKKMSKIFPSKSALSQIRMDLENGAIYFDGVKMTVGADVVRKALERSQTTFEEMMVDQFGFDVTALETRLFCQMARNYRYGSRALQLEGPSGEGKTEICRVFSGLIGFKLSETTTNNDTDLRNFRGRIKPNRSGGYGFVEADYIDEIQTPGHVFLINEINTNENGLYYWFYPEITGQPFKHLGDYPVSSSDGTVRKARIDRNNLWFFTVNPSSIRLTAQPAITSQMTSFYYAREAEDIPPIVGGIFKRSGFDPARYASFVKLLSRVHIAVKKAQNNEEISVTQEVTLRNLHWTVELFDIFMREDPQQDPIAALRKALEVIYVYSWKSFEDQEFVRQILFRNLKCDAMLLTSRQALDILLRHQNFPIMVFANGANDYDEFESHLRDVEPTSEVRRIVIGPSFGERQFLSGLQPVDAPQAVAMMEERLGIYAQLIAQARFNGGRVLYAALIDYTHMNGQIASLPNEFFQKKKLKELVPLIDLSLAQALIERIIKNDGLAESLLRECPIESLHAKDIQALMDDEKVTFARWFYSESPPNLKFVAYVSGEEEGLISSPEYNRFRGVNIGEPIDEGWVEATMKSHLTEGMQHKALITATAVEIFKLYEEQKDNEEYPHNRLSRADFDVYLQELKSVDNLTEDRVRALAYYTLGIGLKTPYRNKLSFKYAPPIPDDFDPTLLFEQRGDRWYFVLDGMAFATQWNSKPSKEELGKFAMTQGLYCQLVAMCLAIKYHRPIAIEGFPGGGKTSSVGRLATLLGQPLYEEQMFENIDYTQFFGKMSKWQRRYILTALQKAPDGKPILPFLRAYTSGGLYLGDEGAIGVDAQYVISLLTRLSRLPGFDLGIFHPGLEGVYLERNPGFHFVIAQNPHGTTDDREPLLYGTDMQMQKIWVDSKLTKEEALLLIATYENPKHPLPEHIKQLLADIHVFLSKQSGQADNLSPRQLINVTQRLNDALSQRGDVMKALFEGVMISYLRILSSREFDDVWNKIETDLTSHQWATYLAAWKAAVRPIPSRFVSNVTVDQIEFSESLPSQNITINGVRLSLASHRPVALLGEDGSDPFDFIKKIAHRDGYQLHTLWSDGDMNQSHIHSAFLPQMETAMDRYGIIHESSSKDFEIVFGFLTRSLVDEKEFEGMSADQKAQRQQEIYYCSSFDMIPERQRVILNQLFTTNKTTITDARGVPHTYVLPPWIHIVVSAPVSHRFSSAFVNRFDVFRISPIDKYDEVAAIIKRRYSLVRDDELGLLYGVVKSMNEQDTRSGGLGISYGFSMRDVFTLAQRIHLEKQKDLQSGTFKDDGLYYLVQALYLTYELALNPEERGKLGDIVAHVFSKFYQHEFEGVDLIPGYMAAHENVERDLDEKKTETVTAAYELTDFNENQPVSFPNGLTLVRTIRGFKVGFVGTKKVYEWTIAQLQAERGVSSAPDRLNDFRLRVQDEKLIVEMDLIASLGGAALHRDKFNQEHAVPESEAHSDYFTRYTRQLTRAFSCLLRSQERIRETTGYEYAPRVVMLPGGSGLNKTNGIRNLAAVWGVPVYILNAHTDLKANHMLMELKLNQNEFEVNVKEFLARIGKINGQRVYIKGKTTSNRTILLIDEANASADVMIALAPLFRGEKKFDVRYAGKKFSVEVDDQVTVVLSFNPAEAFSGRGLFERDLMTRAQKIWLPNPLEYEDKVLDDILMEDHLRDSTEDLPHEHSGMAAEAFQEVSPVRLTIEPRDHPGEKIIDMSNPPPQPAKKLLSAAVTIEHNLKKLIEDAEGFKRENFDGGESRKMFLYFAEHILGEFIAAYSNGHRDVNTIRSVMQAIDRLDPTLGPMVHRVMSVFDQSSLELRELSHAIDEIKDHFIDQGVYPFVYIFGKNGRYVIKMMPVNVEGLISLKREHLEALGEAPEHLAYKTVSTKAIVVENEPLTLNGMALGYCNGRHPVVIKSRLRTTRAEWVGWHELGHLIDKQRLVARSIPLIPGEVWTAMARRVNAMQKKIWVSENLELNAMLFPAMFSDDAKTFLLNEVVPRLTTGNRDPKDYYVQACKGILNAFLIKKGRKADADLISDDLEKGRIEQAVAIIRGMDDQKINTLAIEFYRNPETYLSTAKKGVYYQRSGGGAGGDTGGVDELSSLDSVPEVEYIEDDSVDEEYASVEIPEPLGDQPELKQETPAERDSKVADVLVPEGDFDSFTSISLPLVNRFLKAFAGKPKFLRIYDDSGDIPVLERLILGESNVFLLMKRIFAPGYLNIEIVMDTSGSTAGALHDSFYKMTQTLGTLFYLAAKQNKNMTFTLSKIDEQYGVVLDAKDCRDPDKVKRAIKWFEHPPLRGGINTMGVIKGLKEYYKGKKYQRNTIVLVLTDGGETSGRSKGQLRDGLNSLEKSANIDIGFVGVGKQARRDISKYSKRIGFDQTPTDKELVEMIIELCLFKNAKKKFPEGDLSKIAGITASRSPDSSMIPGGINLNITDSLLDIEKETGPIKFVFSQESLTAAKIDGLEPCFIDFIPLEVRSP